jgi:hypothetical protein
MRGDVISADETGPIYVATHASDLAEVLTGVPRNRRGDLVFLQGGLLRTKWLEKNGLRGATQVALYMSADAAGNVRDGNGGTVVTGPWAQNVVRTLAAGGVACNEVTAAEFDRVALEKLLWTSIFWLLCDVAGGATVGDVIGRACQMFPATSCARMAPPRSSSQVASYDVASNTTSARP